MNLFDLLQKQFPDSSKNAIRSWLKQGRVLVDSQTIRDGEWLVSSEAKITLGPRKHFIEEGIEILYEDKHIVVIDKPAGLLSVATAFDLKNTAHACIKRHYYPKKIFVIHRLDQETSGVMLFVFTEEAFVALKKIFAVHDIERKYMAIVEGALKEDRGTWISYLYEDANYTIHSSDDSQKGQKAITHFQVVAKNQYYSKLILQLETGRKNQIRVHCQKAGCPIAGDFKYGAKTSPQKRLCLHAYLLAFKHPITGKQMRFISRDPFQADQCK